MAHRLTSRQRLARLTETLARDLPALCQGGRVWTPYLSRTVLPGELPSHRIIARSVERREPRAFTVDDDPSDIDVGRLPPAAAQHFAEAALAGELLVVQSQQVTESEFVSVIDVSRSMLAGFFLERSAIAVPDDATAKLCQLFYTASCFLHLASGVGFQLRAICARGEQVHNQRAVVARDFLPATLGRMRSALLCGHAEAEQDPGLDEAWGLGNGLRAALSSVRVRSVVLVVSDFLDPFETYGEALVELMARHHVILADVAEQYELRFPLPPRLGQSHRIEVREGARHLEHGIRAQPITRARARAWNVERQAERRRLLAAARRGSREYYYVAGRPAPASSPTRRQGAADFARCYELAQQCLRRIA